MNTTLIREAQLLTTGAEVHRTNGLVAMYRGAAADMSPQGQIAATQFEEALETHVGMLRARRFRRETCRT